MSGEGTARRLTIVGILRDRVRSEGMLGLWRGEWINSVTNFMTKFCFFFCYSVLTQWYLLRERSY